jgi:hypothetical protein
LPGKLPRLFDPVLACTFVFGNALVTSAALRRERIVSTVVAPRPSKSIDALFPDP